MDVQEMIAENLRRNLLLKTDYDPLTGRGGCGSRIRTSVEWEAAPVWLPVTMLNDPQFRLLKSREEYVALRFRHDFEYWCATCVKVRQKLTGEIDSLILNAPQRRMLAEMEKDRLEKKPIRIILLKARQWGGSTLIQMYMAWIQSVLRRNWHSLVTAHVKNTAATLRQLYSTTLANYPEELWDGDEKPRFRPMPDASNTRIICGRGCNVTIASSFSPDSIRGIDLSMAHLTEVAFWKDSECIDPADMLRSICGTVPLAPDTLVAVESTANGMGNFFHSEWQRAVGGESVFRPIFVPWYEIGIYRLPVRDPGRFIEEMDNREKAFWDKGLTLEMIAWYRMKLREMGDIRLMQAEYPTDAVEAFVSSNTDVFSPRAITELRAGCTGEPEKGEVQGETPLGEGAIRDVRFVPDECGSLKVWERPEGKPARNRYVVAVDVGGRSSGSDWSVIAVLDRTPRGGGGPAVVAQWRGHCDHDILGWKAAAIARWYHEALLVIESNTLDAASQGSSQLILEQLNRVYRNLYTRQVLDGSSGSEPLKSRVGFHTNHRTKALIITMLIAMVREKAYRERDPDALTEMSVYRQLPSGNFAAKKGFHDDILMTRAMGLYVSTTMPPPRTFDIDDYLSPW